jgi:GrpB-like predicted nucleotidyltransferase (UPF0157 family)
MDVRPAAALAAAGLGLDYGQLRLARTTEAWLAAGAGLRDRVAGLLVDHPVQVIGSSSVPGLLAKPIIDLAVGIDAGADTDADPGTDAGQLPTALLASLVTDGWIYRGDAGGDGGHVFVLELRPWHRVAHLHVVDHNGQQWCDYLALRDLLRRSPEARARYQAVKLRLAERQPTDRKAYTSGKTDVITELLAGDGC